MNGIEGTPAVPRPRRAAIALLALATANAGCLNKGSSTEPNGMYVLATGTFATTDGSASILECHQSLDDQQGFRAPTYSPAAAQVDVFIENLTAGRGHHTLTFRVSAQTQSPTTYRASGLVVELVEACFSFDGGCPVLVRRAVPDATATLRTGESMTIPFDL
jgi:hypothetical protein